MPIAGKQLFSAESRGRVRPRRVNGIPGKTAIGLPQFKEHLGQADSVFLELRLSEAFGGAHILELTVSAPVGIFPCGLHGDRPDRIQRPNLCVCQRTSSLCALPFPKPCLSNFSSLILLRVLRFPHLFISRGRLSCSAAQPRRISSPHLPSIEFA
jgi:hypothetical protein